VRSIFGLLKPDISPDWRWRIPMKNLFLAAVATLSLGVGAANATVVGDHSTIAGDRSATLFQQTGGGLAGGGN